MESAREVYDDCCRAIAKRLEAFGFEYRPGKHTAIHAEVDLTFEIRFQSSYLNRLIPEQQPGVSNELSAETVAATDYLAFGMVGLIEHASVRSRVLKRWRRSVNCMVESGDFVTGGQIGNLQSPPTWIEFNLANPQTRRDVMAEAFQLIERVALPYFTLFRTTERVISDLLDGSMPWFWESTALEYVCCFGTGTQAKVLLDRFIGEKPADRRSIAAP